jgi:hypothetical protein
MSPDIVIKMPSGLKVEITFTLSGVVAKSESLQLSESVQEAVEEAILEISPSDGDPNSVIAMRLAERFGADVVYAAVALSPRNTEEIVY